MDKRDNLKLQKVQQIYKFKQTVVCSYGVCTCWKIIQMLYLWLADQGQAQTNCKTAWFWSHFFEKETDFLTKNKSKQFGQTNQTVRLAKLVCVARLA